MKTTEDKGKAKAPAAPAAPAPARGTTPSKSPGRKSNVDPNPGHLFDVFRFPPQRHVSAVASAPSNPTHTSTFHLEPPARYEPMPPLNPAPAVPQTVERAPSGSNPPPRGPSEPARDQLSSFSQPRRIRAPTALQPAVLHVSTRLDVPTPVHSSPSPNPSPASAPRRPRPPPLNLPPPGLAFTERARPSPPRPTHPTTRHTSRRDKASPC